MAATPISQNEKFLKEWRSSLNDEILKSPCAPVTIPQETLIERILRSLKLHAAKCPDKAAVIDAFNQEHFLTYTQLHDRTLSFAGFLTSRGFRVGDRLTVALPNSIEWPLAHLGAWAAGGSVVGSSTAFKLYDTAYQLRDSASSVVVVAEELLDTVVKAAEQCPAVKMIICVRASDNPLPEGVIDFEEAIRHEPLKEIAPVTLNDECLLFYSSGTTGLPKGVIHTHRAFHCAIAMFTSHWLSEIYPVLGVQAVDWHEESQIVIASCCHSFGFQLLNWFIVMGCPIVLAKAFDGDIYLEVIEKYKPRFLLLSPAVLAFLSKDEQGKKAPLSSVQMMICSTAPLSKGLSDQFFLLHPNVQYIVQGYGMTESNVSHMPLLLAKGANASAGILTACYEQKIIDPSTHKPCKQGQLGEIWLRGTPQTIGYLDKPDETKALIDEEGWMHTGDVGYIDELGLLYIVDRMKELIKVYYNNQTLQVAPAQIEGILLSHHKIRDAAIVGISTPTSGELIRAFVVKADETLTGEEVENIVAENLAGFKRITGGVIFVDAIPRSPIGKILRTALKEITGA